MLIVSTNKGFALAFQDREELELVIQHLTDYINHTDDTERYYVYHVSDPAIDTEIVRKDTMNIKKMLDDFTAANHEN